MVTAEPAADGMFAFQNGVTVYALLSPRNNDIEILCEGGYVVARSAGAAFELYRLQTKGERRFEAAPFPAYQKASSTLRLIEDLVHSLDTGEPTRGGVRVAAANTELLFAFIESHRQGGRRVALPLDGNTLRFARQDIGGRQPKIAPSA